MEVDPEFLKMIVNERPMVRMLMIINDAEGAPTRKILKRLGANGLHTLLTKAEEDGYIRREERKPEGKGNHLVCNYLTDKGRALVRFIKQFQT